MKNWRKQSQKFLTFSLIFCVRAYQKIFSPDHGILERVFGNNRCRFFPSCSEYTLQAVRQYGLFRGCVLSMKRISRCHPWNDGGYDPLDNAKYNPQEN